MPYSSPSVCFSRKCPRDWAFRFDLFVRRYVGGRRWPGGINFDDYSLTYLVSNLALVILLDGGMRTKVAKLQSRFLAVNLPATIRRGMHSQLNRLMAAWLFDLSLMQGILVMQSSVRPMRLRYFLLKGQSLNERVGSTLEIESYH